MFVFGSGVAGRGEWSLHSRETPYPELLSISPEICQAGLVTAFAHKGLDIFEIQAQMPSRSSTLELPALAGSPGQMDAHCTAVECQAMV